MTYEAIATIIAIGLGYLVTVSTVNRWCHVTLRKKLFYPVTVLPPSLVLYVIGNHTNNISSNEFSTAATIMFGLLGLPHILDLPGFLIIRRKAEVRIAIASNAAFNRELRNGLNEKIVENFAEINLIDLFKKQNNSMNNYDANEQFKPLFLDSITKTPDYLIAHPPSRKHACDPQILATLSWFACKRTQVFFIENLPERNSTTESDNQPGKNDKYRRRVTAVYSDSDAGATVQWNEVLKYSAKLKDLRILYITGPEDSQPANKRQKFLTGKVTEMNGKIHKTRWWGMAEGAEAIQNYHKENSGYPNLVIAENDVLALGAIDEFRRTNQDTKDLFVIGYDGIFLALAEVSSHESPFKATIYTPPRGYGAAIANAILNDLHQIRTRKKEDIIINVDANSLKTESLARELLGHL